ncbi:MAG: cation diffusion facilitator family transporter [Chloroflexi bacterium]|nr:cation diffusion facilitator family transporter [Chloroflexota bacterium]
MFNSKTSVAALSVASNTTLTLLKLIIGISIGSVSVIAEAIHSGIDLLAATIAFFAVRTSAKPPDAKYQYGRGKIENISGTVEAVLIFIAALLIVYESANKLINGFELPQVDLGLVAMAVSVVVNIVVSRQLFKVGKRTESPALEADGHHLSTDVMTSAGVFAGLVIVRVTGWAILDPLVAIGVAGLIMRVAWAITRRSSGDLLDRSLPDEEQKKVTEILAQHSNLLADFHEIKTRKAAGHRYVDVHLVVKADSSVAEAHRLCDHLEQDLSDALGSCTMSLHVEPCGLECNECSVKCDRKPANTLQTREQPPGL